MREPCGARTRNGGTCPNPPVQGAKRCRMHGGKTGKAMARAQAQQIMRTLGDVPDDVDPAQALLELVKLKYAEMHWLRAKVQEVDANLSQPANAWEEDHAETPSLTWGKTKHVSGTDPETGGMANSTTYETAPNIWWRLLREAEDQLAKYSTAALRAGVERRQLELQEAQAVHLAGAINRILEALELTAEQQAQVPRIVPEVLRSLPMEGSN